MLLAIAQALPCIPGAIGNLPVHLVINRKIVESQVVFLIGDAIENSQVEGAATCKNRSQYGFRRKGIKGFFLQPDKTFVSSYPENVFHEMIGLGLSLEGNPCFTVICSTMR